MDLLQAVRSLKLIPSRRQNAPHQNLGRYPMGLSDLPTEIILSIIRFLPTSSVACLALSSRNFSQMLGTKCWHSLRQGNEGERKTFISILAREAFLSTLARDLPSYFHCRHCSLLHLNAELEPPGPVRARPRKWLPCVETGEYIRHQSHQNYSNYELRFPHVQLAMKSHRHGSEHGIPLEALSFTEVQVCERKDEECTTLLSVEARIASDELLMRTQQWVLIPPRKRDNFASKTSFTDLCPHIRSLRQNTLYRLVASRLGKLGDQYEYPNSAGTHQCKYCPMEFQIGIRELGDRGTAMHVTKWLNLGAGVTDLDPRWRTHLAQLSENRICEVPHPEVPLGSIRSSFEDQKGPSLDSLTEDNAVKLLAKRGRNLWNRTSHLWRQLNAETWILEPSKELSVSKQVGWLRAFVVFISAFVESSRFLLVLLAKLLFEKLGIQAA